MKFGQHEKILKSRKTKSDLMVERLREAILRGEIASGEWLKQDEVAVRFGISPTPVREGLRRLESEGLVEHIPHMGVRVVSYSLNSAREYYDLRILLEPYVLRLAASQINEEDLHELENLIHKAKQDLANGSILELTLTNRQFHRWLQNHSGSRLVEDVLSRITHSFELDTMFMLPEIATRTISEHELILQSLINADVEQAATQMKVHIEHTRDAMLARLPMLGINEKARR